MFFSDDGGTFFKIYYPLQASSSRTYNTPDSVGVSINSCDFCRNVDIADQV